MQVPYPNLTDVNRVSLDVNMGNTYKDKKGYPRWSDTGKLVHRAVAANMIGGPIGKGRLVHHKNGNKSNFRKSNLIVMSRKQHSSLHARKRHSWH
jgi:hypothetical protein